MTGSLCRQWYNMTWFNLIYNKSWTLRPLLVPKFTNILVPAWRKRWPVFYHCLRTEEGTTEIFCKVPHHLFLYTYNLLRMFSVPRKKIHKLTLVGLMHTNQNNHTSKSFPQMPTDVSCFFFISQDILVKTLRKKTFIFCAMRSMSNNLAFNDAG